MTKSQAIEWVRAQEDDAELSEDDLASAFRAIYGRSPDQQVWDDDVWSLCCATIP